MNCDLLSLRLKWQIFRTKSPLIKAYYESLLPVVAQPIAKAPLMAMDLEMTGLDPLQDQILSIALIPIDNYSLNLASAEQQLLQIRGSVGQSATIHGILDNQLHQAVTIEEAMDWFWQSIQGRVLVAHNAPLDCRFLQQSLHGIYQQKLWLPAIDTLRLEKQRLLRAHSVLKEGSLRLGACRERYGLPVYGAHSALTDALACGELLLAQLAAMGALTHRVSELIG